MIARPPAYPFAAIVGQERLKLALLLNAVNPAIGGVLLQGEKGTAKSTAVRGLAALLPEIAVVAGCAYACDPATPAGLCAACAAGGESVVRRRPIQVVTLPIGATEDRLLGTLDLERAIVSGERRFEPGLLAAAHRGILAIDEVNLLADHLVDALLDAAALGVNTVEREGVSVSHPAAFILIGTMNPEEGELRPQLLDRFGLSVAVETERDPALRAEIVRRRVAFEADPAGFAAAWAPTEAAERARIAAARARLPATSVPEPLLELIVALCLAAGVDGARPDIVIHKAARTLAALAGRAEATVEDVRRAAELALAHRRRQPFDAPRAEPPDLDQMIDDWQRRQPPDLPPQPPPTPPSSESPPAEPPQPSPDAQADAEPASDGQGAAGNAPSGEQGDDGPERRSRRAPAAEQVFAIGQAAAPPLPPTVALRRPGGRAREQAGGAAARTGPRAGLLPRHADGRDLAAAATLRAAAAHQPARRARRAAPPALRIEGDDLRWAERRARPKRLILFVVDASGSMGARARMSAAKGAVVSLLAGAYQRRDRVGLIACRGGQASLLLPPTASVTLAHRRLADLPTGGRTPLAHGLALARTTIAQARRRDPTLRPLLVVVSDGRANVPLGGGNPLAEARTQAAELARQRAPALVIDAEDGATRLGLARDLSASLAAPCYRLRELTGVALAGAVRAALREGVGGNDG